MFKTCVFVCPEESYGAVYFFRLRSGLLDLRNLLNQNVKVGLGTGISSHFIYRGSYTSAHVLLNLRVGEKR